MLSHPAYTRKSPQETEGRAMSGELAHVVVPLRFSPASEKTSWCRALRICWRHHCLSDKQPFQSPAERRQQYEWQFQVDRRKDPGLVRSWNETRALMAEQVLQAGLVALHPHFVERQEDQYGNRTG